MSFVELQQLLELGEAVTQDQARVSPKTRIETSKPDPEQVQEKLAGEIAQWRSNPKFATTILSRLIRPGHALLAATILDVMCDSMIEARFLQLLPHFSSFL